MYTVKVHKIKAIKLQEIRTGLRSQVNVLKSRRRELGIDFMHDDALLISFTTKPHIQNANVFPEDWN